MHFKYSRNEYIGEFCTNDYDKDKPWQGAWNNAAVKTRRLQAHPSQLYIT